jgi:hypothetical protein
VCAEPYGGIERRLPFLANRFTAEARPLFKQKIASRFIRTVPTKPMLGNKLSDPHKCICDDLSVDHFMRIDRLRMNVRAILPLLDINSKLVERNCLDRAELLTADASEIFATANLGLLRWERVPMDWRASSAANGSSLSIAFEICHFPLREFESGCSERSKTQLLIERGFINTFERHRKVF